MMNTSKAAIFADMDQRTGWDTIPFFFEILFP